MALEDLQQTPDAIIAAGVVTGRIDTALARGFARLTPDTRDALGSVAKTFTGTPLGGALDDAVAGLDGGVRAEHLAVLAAARVALEGARYDALLAQAAEAVGVTFADEPEAASIELDVAADPLLDSVRQWLLEIALAGTMQLERATVQPFVAVLETLQERPELVRLSALLTGFVTELLDHVPTASMDVVPQKRWADLWSRAMVLASQPTQYATTTPITGLFKPLGVDVRLHDNLANAEVWGVLHADGTAQVARASVSAWKVDVVSGAEIWTVLAAHHKSLLELVSKGISGNVASMASTQTGMLIWEGDHAKAAPKAPALETAKQELGAAVHAKALPFNRHPVQIGIPLYLEGCTYDATKGTVTSQGATLPLALNRLSPLGPEDKTIFKSKSLVGILRFDADRWCVQPLTAMGKDGVAPSLAAGLKAKSGSAAILKERASKLLRQKS